MTGRERTAERNEDFFFSIVVRKAKERGKKTKRTGAKGKRKSPGGDEAAATASAGPCRKVSLSWQLLLGLVGAPIRADPLSFGRRSLVSHPRRLPLSPHLSFRRPSFVSSYRDEEALSLNPFATENASCIMPFRSSSCGFPSVAEGSREGERPREGAVGRGGGAREAEGQGTSGPGPVDLSA